jgi:hypothetical protein
MEEGLKVISLVMELSAGGNNVNLYRLYENENIVKIVSFSISGI